MSRFLFADAEAPGFLRENWLTLLPVALGFVAIYLLLPQARRARPLWAGALAAFALILGAAVLIRNEAVSAETVLFYAFAGGAIVGGAMMITQRNPVHAALSFALVVLSTCGLFLLQAAPFLMAATIIIYAGAIVVTFLFVIMLAQQEGVSNADQRSREPFLASLAGGVLLAALACVLHKAYDTRELNQVLPSLRALAKSDADVKSILGDPKEKKNGELSSPLVDELLKQYPEGEIFAHVNDLNRAWVQGKAEMVKTKAKRVLDAVESSRQQHGSLALGNVPGKDKTPGHFPPGRLPAANVAALGRTLFTDYLIPVELAAVLLLVATIGAIVIAGRKAEGLR